MKVQHLKTRDERLCAHGCHGGGHGLALCSSLVFKKIREKSNWLELPDFQALLVVEPQYKVGKHLH